MSPRPLGCISNQPGLQPQLPCRWHKIWGLLRKHKINSQHSCGAHSPGSLPFCGLVGALSYSSRTLEPTPALASPLGPAPSQALKPFHSMVNARGERRGGFPGASLYSQGPISPLGCTEELYSTSAWYPGPALSPARGEACGWGAPSGLGIEHFQALGPS